MAIAGTWNGSVSLSTLGNDGLKCSAMKELAYHLYMAVMVSAAGIVLLLCCTSRRSQHCKNVLWGIPSVAVPVNLIGVGSSGYRLVYCVVLACWGADLLHSVLDQSLYYSSPFGILDVIYFFVFSPTVIILRQALAYFPVFACVDASIPILGHLTGLLYTALMVSSNVYCDYVTAQGCSYRRELTHREIGIAIGSRASTYLLYLCLLLTFFMFSVHDIVHILLLGQRLTRKSTDDMVVYEQYVKNLLRRHPKSSPHMMRGSLWNYLLQGLDYVLPNAYTFYLRYPLPLLGGFFMGFAMITHLVIYWSAWEYIMAENLLHWLQEFQITVTTIEDLLPPTKPHLDRLFDQVLSFAKAYERMGLCMIVPPVIIPILYGWFWQVILPLGSVIAYGLCAMFSLYMIQNTHKHLVEAAKGDTSFFVRSELIPSLAYRLAATMRFTAFLVAYLVCSWMIFSLVMWILMSIGLAFYYAFNDYKHFAIHFWSWFMIPMMWGAAMHNVQLFLCKYLFLERHRGTLPLLRLKWLYQLLTYFLFFFNAIFGFVMCVFRVFALIVFTIVMLFRLDWDVYMRGLEGWDTGHRTYMAYLYMEYSYNNMILRLFPHLLLETMKKRKSRLQEISAQRREAAAGAAQQRGSETEKGDGCSSVASSFQSVLHTHSGELRSHRACLRWYLAFTLLRNPSLCQDRVHSTHHTHSADYGATYAIS